MPCCTLPPSTSRLQLCAFRNLCWSTSDCRITDTTNSLETTRYQQHGCRFRHSSGIDHHHLYVGAPGGQFTSEPAGSLSETDNFPVPPLGVYAIAGCGMDLFVNICLTVLGYVLTPGQLPLRGVTKLTAAVTQILPRTPPCLLPRIHLLRPTRANQERHAPSCASAGGL